MRATAVERVGHSPSTTPRHLAERRRAGVDPLCRTCRRRARLPTGGLGVWGGASTPLAPHEFTGCAQLPPPPRLASRSPCARPSTPSGASRTKSYVPAGKPRSHLANARTNTAYDEASARIASKARCTGTLRRLPSPSAPPPPRRRRHRRRGRRHRHVRRRRVHRRRRRLRRRRPPSRSALQLPPPPPPPPSPPVAAAAAAASAAAARAESIDGAEGEYGPQGDHRAKGAGVVAGGGRRAAGAARAGAAPTSARRGAAACARLGGGAATASPAALASRSMLLCLSRPEGADGTADALAAALAAHLGVGASRYNVREEGSDEAAGSVVVLRWSRRSPYALHRRSRRSRGAAERRWAVGCSAEEEEI